MALTSLSGNYPIPFGIAPQFGGLTPSTTNSFTMDAANESLIITGQIVTADGGSHTIDTSGSSSLQWLTGAVTFASGSTTVKVGLAAVDTTNGPAARAVNVAHVITFDVSASFTGGGGGITGTAWQTSVPTAGTKTIANGDYVAFAVQMTARGGADSIVVNGMNQGFSYHRPSMVSLVGTTYTPVAQVPDVLIVFSDGTLGWFYTSDIRAAVAVRTWNSGDATKEYGQLYSLPFPARISGLYGWLDPDNDCDIILYSDPLGGSPVAEKTISIDANAVSAPSGARFSVMFPAAYDVAANTPIAAVFKPGGSNVSAYYKTLNNAAHRVTDMGGTSSYGVSRASGAFANANSSLDHYYIGLMLSGADDGASGGGGTTGIGALVGGSLAR